MMSGAIRNSGSLGREDPKPARKSTIVGSKSRQIDEDPIVNELVMGQEPIRIPESINMDGKILDVSERQDDSEHLDRVASLN